MSAIDFAEKAEELANNDAVSQSADEIEQMMLDINAEFGLPREEVVNTVIDRVTPDDEVLGNETVVIGDLEEVHGDGGTWIDVAQAQVMSTWNIDHSSVAQKAELADETGRAVVTIWADDGNEPSLEEGDTVSLEGVVTDKYQGSVGINIPGSAEVEAIDAEIDPDDGHVTGEVVAVKNGSGLVKRCGHEDCNRTLDSGKCSEHGDVDHEFDLRILAVIDDGENPTEVVANQEATEELMDTTLDEVQQEAIDAMDFDMFGRQIEDALLGTFMSVEGPDFGRQVLVEDYVQMEEIGTDELDEVLIQARSLEI